VTVRRFFRILIKGTIENREKNCHVGSTIISNNEKSNYFIIAENFPRRFQPNLIFPATTKKTKTGLPGCDLNVDSWRY
jgi:hypothetical protein